MSGALTTAGVPATATPYIGDVYFLPYRAIGTIVPNLLIAEIGRDNVEITEHPTEYGATITDHAYKRPVALNIRAGWANSGQYPGYVIDVYNALIALQNSLVPLVVYTGKRQYTNMLIEDITQTTNGTTGDFTLMIEAYLKEIIIVNTSAVQTAPPAAQAKPASTQSIQRKGNGRLTTPSKATQKTITKNCSASINTSQYPASSSSTSISGAIANYLAGGGA